MIVLLFSAGSVFAAESVEASASVNKKELSLGDVVRYTITVKRSMQGNMAITRSPDIIPPSFEGFRVGGTYSSSSVNIINNNAQVVTTRHYDLVAVQSGEVTIQPSKVKFYDAESKTQKTIETKPVTLTVTKGGKRYKPPKPTPTQAAPADIRDIKMKLDFRWSDFLPFIILIIVFILLVIAAAYFIFRKRPEKEIVEKETDYRAEAIKRIRKAEQFLKRGNVKGFYYDVYEAVRYFLSRHFTDSFDELTTQEIVRKLKDKKIKEKDISVLRDFMKDCDIVKFADYRPKQDEIDAIYTTAESIILKM